MCRLVPVSQSGNVGTACTVYIEDVCLCVIGIWLLNATGDINALIPSICNAELILTGRASLHQSHMILQDRTHMHTWAYMSVETADIPLSVSHPTHSGGLLYNAFHQEKSADHLRFTHRLIITITLMLLQRCRKVCITLFIDHKESGVFHKNTLKWWKILLRQEIILWDKKSGWSKCVLVY